MKFFQEHKKDLGACGIIALAVLLFYGRTLFYGGDIWDDQFYAALFRDGTSLDNLLRQIQSPVLKLHSPLVTFSFWIEALIFGPRNAVMAAHGGNVFYFLLSAVGLYGIFRSFRVPGGEDSAGRALPILWCLGGTLLWCCQPQRAESVAWISERKDVLLACCAWWGCFLFIRGFRARRFSWGAFVLFCLSFAVKPMLVLFPLLLGLWIFLETKRKRDLSLYKCLIPYGVVSALVLVSNIGAVGEGGVSGALSFGERSCVLLWCLGNYAVTALLPVGYGPFHPHFPGEGWGYFYGASLMLILWLAAVLRFPRKREALLWGIGSAAAGFLLLLGPAAGFFRIGNADWADRYDLLASFPVVLAVTAFCSAGAESRKKAVRVGAVAGFAALLLWSGAAGFTYVPAWRDSETVTARAMTGKRVNYRVVFAAACRAMLAGDGAKFGELMKRLPPPEELAAPDRVTVEVFHQAMAAAWAFKRGDAARGCELVCQLLDNPWWGQICTITDGFPQMLLGDAAEYCLDRKENLKAAEILEKLALCYRGDMEEFFYKGNAALLRNESSKALLLLEEAHRMAPKDKGVKHQLDEARRRVMEIKR